MSDSQRVVCVECGTINQLPPERAAEAAKCGKCGVRLFTGQPADVPGPMLDRQIAKGTLPVVVDIWAPWCGPCRAMAPEFEKSAQRSASTTRFLKLNSDNEQEVSARLGIRGIPTMILFEGGREVARTSGAMSSAQIDAWLGEHRNR